MFASLMQLEYMKEPMLGLALRCDKYRWNNDCG